MSFVFSSKKTASGRVLDEKQKKAKKLKPEEQALEAFTNSRNFLQLQILALPEGARKTELGMLLAQADTALGTDKKKPKVIAAQLKLEDVREAIREERRRLAKAAEDIPLDDLKRKVAGEVDNLMAGERSARALPMLEGVRKQMRLRLPATVARCDTLLQGFDKDLDAERKRLDTYLKASLGKPNIGIDAFRTQCYDMLRLLRGKLATFGEALEKVRDEAEVKPEDQWKFYEKNKADPEVARAALRSTQVNQEIPRLKAAVAQLDKTLKELQASRAGARSLDDKKALEAEYTEAFGQKLRLAGRLAQMQAYSDDEDDRFNLLILNREKAAGVDHNAAAMLKAVDKPDDPAFNGLQAAQSEPGFQTFDKDALTLQEGKMRALFERSSKRVIRAERIFPGEPDVIELSAQEHAALVKMLDLSKQLTAKGQFGLASAAQNDANKLWMEFVTARKNALPPAPDVAPSKEVLLTNALKRLEPRVLDIEARGHGHADIFAKARRDLLDNVAAEVLNVQYGWDQLEREVDDLDRRLSEAEAGLPVSSATISGIKAKETGQKVNATLAKLYRTEKITDLSKIEDPAKNWGKDGPPKDLIPLSQVIRVGDGDSATYLRILTYETGGKDVDRRETKGVPREMMAHLRNRSEALEMMASTLAKGCEEDVARYADETEKLLADVTSPAGQKAYEACEKLLKEIDGWLKERPLDKYLPSGLAEAKKDLATFKKEYVTRSPVELHKRLPDLHQRFVALREAGKLLHKQYAELGDRIGGIHLELSSILTESGMGDGNEIGARMGRMFNGEAERLAKKVPSLDPAVLKRIQDASAKMMSQVKDRTAGANNLAGEWRRKLEEAWRMKEGYSQSAIETASGMVDEIAKGIRAFHDDLNGLGKKTEAEQVAFFEKLAARMEDGADGAEQSTQLDAQWKERRDKVKERIKLIKEEKLEGRTNTEELKARYSGLKARIEATEDQVKKFLDRQWGIEQMDSLTRELDNLLVDVTGNPGLKEQEISKITAKERAEAIGPMLARLANAAAAAADLIDQKVKGDTGQMTAYSRQIDAAKKALQNVKGLPDAGTLVALCTQIDAKRGDKADTHQAKQERRERALAELNRLRRIVSNHPAVEVYRSNPFDGGRVYPLVMGAFHRAEVGILVSVDPHAA